MAIEIKLQSWIFSPRGPPLPSLSPSPPRAALLLGTFPCRTRCWSSRRWVTKPCSQQIQNTNKHGPKQPDLAEMCVFLLDITDETLLELANIRTLAYFGQCSIFSGYGSLNGKKRHTAMFVSADSAPRFCPAISTAIFTGKHKSHH